MAKEENFDGVLKPFEEKLTCSYCKMLFEEPTLMSCDHIFCMKCIPKNHEASVCFICKTTCKSSDLRPTPYISEMIQAYKETDAFIKAKNDHHLSPTEPFTRERPVPIVEPTMSPKFSSHMSVEGLLYDDMDDDNDNDDDYVPGVETDGESDYDESSFDFDYSTSEDDESSTCSGSDE